MCAHLVITWSHMLSAFECASRTRHLAAVDGSSLLRVGWRLELHLRCANRIASATHALGFTER